MQVEDTALPFISKQSNIFAPSWSRESVLGGLSSPPSLARGWGEQKGRLSGPTEVELEQVLYLFL